MTLIKDGYFQDTYWASRYWQEDYWPEYGSEAAPTAPAATAQSQYYPTRRRLILRRQLSPETLALIIDYLELKLHDETD